MAPGREKEGSGKYSSEFFLVRSEHLTHITRPKEEGGGGEGGGGEGGGGGGGGGEHQLSSEKVSSAYEFT